MSKPFGPEEDRMPLEARLGADRRRDSLDRAVDGLPDLVERTQAASS